MHSLIFQADFSPNNPSPNHLKKSAFHPLNVCLQKKLDSLLIQNVFPIGFSTVILNSPIMVTLKRQTLGYFFHIVIWFLQKVTVSMATTIIVYNVPITE